MMRTLALLLIVCAGCSYSVDDLNAAKREAQDAWSQYEADRAAAREAYGHVADSTIAEVTGEALEPGEWSALVAAVDDSYDSPYSIALKEADRVIKKDRREPDLAALSKGLSPDEAKLLRRRVASKLLGQEWHPSHATYVAAKAQNATISDWEALGTRAEELSFKVERIENALRGN